MNNATNASMENTRLCGGKAVSLLSRALIVFLKARGIQGLVAVSVSAIFLVLAVPPQSLGVLVWVVLVPLAVLVHQETVWRAAGWGFLFGIFSLTGILSWLWQLPAFNIFDALLLFGYLATYPLLWCAAIAWLAARRLPWVWPGALLWVLLDLLRAHAGPLALPWEPLAHSQTGNLPVLQLAALGGAPLISFVLAFANLGMANALLKKSVYMFLAVVGAVGAVHLGGALRMPDQAVSDGLRIAVVQPADDGVPPVQKIERLRELTRQAALEHPSLIVWPESAVNGFGFDPHTQRQVKGAVRAAGVPILFGSADFGKYAKDAPGAREGTQFKNQAFLVSPDGMRQESYTKNRLVPFGEFMPFAGLLEWPQWLVAKTRHGIAGEKPGIFQLGNGITAGVLICWENLFSDDVARLVAHGASIIVQLSNDSDFGHSAEPYQHSAASILRAVEHGRPWVLASANGPSMIVDSYGRVTAGISGVGIAGSTADTVMPVETITIFGQFGLGWLGFVALVVLTVLVSRIYQRGGAYAYRKVS